MNLEDYRLGGRERYAEFVEAVRQILAASVKAAGLKPHAITGRAKDVVSLEKKLRDNNIPLDSPIDEALKDLAGARIVFLTNRQVDAFRNSGIIQDNFEILNVNEHHPVPGTETATRRFDSTNICVGLKPERAVLPEYANFAGLKCEIQVQTLLNHAWAEMSHDTSYKGPDLRHVDQDQLKRINERLDKVMTDHLLQAGHDFDKISRDFDLLVRADRDFEPTVAMIAGSASNNALSAAFDTINDVVLPRVADRARRFLELLPSIIDAVERTRGTGPEEVEVEYGRYPGESGEDVARKASSVIERHRYCDPQVTFEAIVRLHLGAQNDERRLWLDLGRTFSENSIDVFRTHGPIVQRIVVDGFAAMVPERIAEARELAVAMLQKVLSSEVTGVAHGDFNQINFQMGAIPTDDGMRRVRADAIVVLARLLDTVPDDAEKFAIIDALHEACRMPQNGNEALHILVMNDAADVATVLRRIAPVAGLEVRRRMQINALHVHYWYHALPATMAGNGDLVAAQQRLVAELLNLRNALDADPDFVLYKTLIGHDSVHPTAWDGQHFDHVAAEQWRQTSRPSILAEIDESRADEWIARVRRYLAEPMGISDRRPLVDFTRAMARTHPGVAERMLHDMDEVLSALLVPLLEGLEAAGCVDIAVHAVNRLISEGRFLFELGDWFADRKIPDPKLLAKIAERARELGDRRGVVSTMNAAGKQYANAPDPALISAILMPGIEYATKENISGWTRDAWWVAQGGILGGLDEAQCDRVLRSFVDAKQVNHDSESVLAKVASRFPQLVLDFFEARIGRGRDENGERLDPIPYHLNELRGPLSSHPRMLLRTARRMYDFKPSLHRFYGGRLVAKIFPTLEPALATHLSAIITKGGRDDFNFVIETLRPYEGAKEVYPIVMDLVDRIEDGDAMLGRVSIVLDETGVVSGEFGRVEAKADQRNRLQPFLSDPRPKVAAFAKAQIRAISQSMAQEQRRATRELEQAMLDWG